jgi:leader peptidase (prepilin peptidase)/N-methyltransferase
VTVLIAVISGVYGLVIGSFLNVVIWRVPRHESLVAPGSHCPACNAPIAPRDNVPLVSWALLRGRCRHCRTPISSRYPFVELTTAVLFAGVGARFAQSWALPAFLLLTAALIAISAIDFEHFIIPNRIIYPVGYASVILLAGAAALEHEWKPFERSLLGALAVFAFFVFVHYSALFFMRQDAMGYGDVRLSVVLGLFLGWLGWLQVFGGLFAGFLLGAVIGMLLIALGIKGRRDRIPFGPFLAAGTMIFVLFGDQIVSWWRGLGR